jgi:hypothetical protein
MRPTRLLWTQFLPMSLALPTLLTFKILIMDIMLSNIHLRILQVTSLRHKRQIL